MTVPERNRRAALTLVVLGPIVAELAWGTTPMSMAWLIVVFLPIYGAGVLLVREAVRRTGRGWPSLIVLGLAYELVEDGIGLQALTSPTIYGAAGWGPRPFGFNLPYWEGNAIYHVVFSILVPIALVELIFPRHGRAPYLGRFGLGVTGVIAVLGVAVLRLTVPASIDPTYVAPVAVPVTCAILAIVLAVVALRLLPAHRRVPVAGAVPTPWVPAGLGLLATLVELGLLFPARGVSQPAFTHGSWVLVPMALAAVLAVSAGTLLARWTGRAGWSPRHTLYLVTGALVGHTVAGILLETRTAFDRWGLVVVVGLTLAGAALLDRRSAAPVPA